MIDYCIWGFGQEGRATLNYLMQHCPDKKITILTDEFDPTIAAELSEPSTLIPISNTPTPNMPQYVYADEGLKQLAQGVFKTVFKSPGISLYRDEIKLAQAKGCKITSATQLWFDSHPDAQKIIVTGTKGKSTTASLLYFCLQRLGLKTRFAGNVGIPILTTMPAEDYTILELSSYQLADLNAQTDIFVLLNLFPEHVPWHGSVKQYYTDKSHNLLSAKRTVTDTQSHLISQQLSNYSGELHCFNSATGFHCHDNNLYFKTEKLQHNYTLLGEHNLANLSCVLTVLNVLNLPWRDILTQLDLFRPLAHRMEAFVNEQGIQFVNDSISTTPESSICAIKCYCEQPLFLILGGAEREQNYTELIEFILQTDAKKCDEQPFRHIALIGVTGKRIEALFQHSQSQIHYQYYASLTEAMTFIMANLVPNSCVLLSPAAPSFGEFKNFQQRGDHFLRLADIKRKHCN